MTQPTPTPAEEEIADAIVNAFAPQIPLESRKWIAKIIAAHRAPAEPELKGDPAQAHAAELEMALRDVILSYNNYRKPSFADSISIARALLATVDAERKAQKAKTS